MEKNQVTGLKCPHVFGIGLGRTGTRSLSRALEILGYPKLKYPINEEDLFASQASCSATGAMVAFAYQKLAVVFPESKFILTEREMVDWLASWRRYAKTQPYRKQCETPYKQKIRRQTYGAVEFDSKLWQEYYQRHTQEIERFFAPFNHRLLKFNVFAGRTTCGETDDKACGEPTGNVHADKSFVPNRLCRAAEGTSADVSSDSWDALCCFLEINPEIVGNRKFPQISHRETNLLKKMGH